MNVPKLDDLEKVFEFKETPIERWVWRIKGSITPHHPYEPAVQYKDGPWVWFWMGNEHRWDGPSSFWKGKHEYWIHGRELTYDKWLVDPRRMEWLRNQMEGI